MEIQNDNKFIEVDLNHYIRIFRARWWFILLLAVIFFGIGLAYTLTTETVYEASTILLIDSSVGSPSADINAIRADEVRTETYAQLFVQRSVLEETAKTLSLKTNLGELRSQIVVNPIVGTQLLKVTVSRSTGESAAAIANALASTFVLQFTEFQSGKYTELQTELLEQLQSLEQTIDETTAAILVLEDSTDSNDIAERLNLTSIQAQYRQSYATVLQTYEASRLSEYSSTASIVITEEAIIPGNPVWPKPELILIVSTIVGVAIAAFVLLIQDYLDDTLKTSEVLKNRFGLIIIGQIGHFEAKKNPLVTVEHPRSPVAEAFRNIRMNLKYLTVDNKVKTLLVTSANQSEGKSTVAANLAVIMARGGQNTLLLDADMRLPKVHSLFNQSNNQGLSELFIDSEIDFNTVIRPTNVPGLTLITCGTLPPNPSELLDTKRSREILSELTQKADIIIIDSPPLLAVSDAVALAQYVDGVILTVRVTKTKAGMLKSALERLNWVHAKILGVLLIDIDNKAANYDEYYFKYEYSGYLEKSKSRAEADLTPIAVTAATTNGNGNGNGKHSSIGITEADETVVSS